MIRTDVLMLLAYCAELWPAMHLPTDRDALELRVKAWLDVLGDLEPAAVQAALAGLADREFAPPVGQLRKAVLESHDKVLGRAAPDTDEAWAEFLAACRQGIYDEPVWSHEAIADTARSFDVRALALGDEHDLLNITQAHFRRAYETSRNRWDRRTHADPPALAKWEAMAGELLRPVHELEAG